MMPLLYRLRRSVALFVCPELSAESRLKATMAEARKMRAPVDEPTVPGLVVINQAAADFDAEFDPRQARYTVTIKQRIRCDAVEFSDGSIGVEWGPEDGSDIRRRVECPPGYGDNPAAAPATDWSDCEASAWSLAPIIQGEWTVVYEPIANYPDAILLTANGVVKDNRLVPGVERVRSHD